MKCINCQNDYNEELFELGVPDYSTRYDLLSLCAAGPDPKERTIRDKIDICIKGAICPHCQHVSLKAIFPTAQEELEYEEFMKHVHNF